VNYDDMPIEQLDEELNKLDAERLAAKERGREIMAVRRRRIEEDNAAVHGLSPEEYAETKRKAAEEGTPLQAALTAVRREGMRQLQVARAQAAQVGVQGKAAGG
jgi:hypothetical protein